MTDSIYWCLEVFAVKWGINLHALLDDLQGSDIYNEDSDSSECN